MRSSHLRLVDRRGIHFAFEKIIGVSLRPVDLERIIAEKGCTNKMNEMHTEISFS